MSGILSILLITSVYAQQPQTSKPELLTNASVIGMVKAGLSQEVIVSKLKVAGCAFVLDVDNLVALKQARVPDPVVRAMLAKDCQQASNAAPLVRDPALGTIQGVLTWDSSLLGHTAENQGQILLLKGTVEIPTDRVVEVTDRNLNVSAAPDSSCASQIQAAKDEGLTSKLKVLAPCSKLAFESIKNQAGALTYEILKSTTTDEKGRFEVVNIAPGQYTLIIRSHHAGALTLRDGQGKVLITPVRIEAGKAVDVSHSFGATEF